MRKAKIADIGPLLKQHHGNIAAVARALNVSRGTIYNRVEESPTLQTILEDARETMLDNAESVLYSKALQGHTQELIFFLRTQGKWRGYTERIEQTGADGGPIEYADATERVARRIDSLAERLRENRDIAEPSTDAGGSGGA